MDEITHGLSFYYLKTVAFIAGKKNPATQKSFFIDIELKNDFKGEIVSKIQFRPT